MKKEGSASQGEETPVENIQHQVQDEEDNRGDEEAPDTKRSGKMTKNGKKIKRKSKSKDKKKKKKLMTEGDIDDPNLAQSPEPTHLKEVDAEVARSQTDQKPKKKKTKGNTSSRLSKKNAKKQKQIKAVYGVTQNSEKNEKELLRESDDPDSEEAEIRENL